MSFTLVHKTGAAKIKLNAQTTIKERLQLVMVHRERDFIGKTMTMNLEKQLLDENTIFLG